MYMNNKSNQLQKVLALLAFVILFFSSSSSLIAQNQITKGSRLINVNGRLAFSQMHMDDNDFKGRNSSYAFSARYGHFVADKLALGGHIGIYGSQHPDTFIQNHLGFEGGVFARYYFMDPESKFNLYSELDIGIGSRIGHFNAGEVYSGGIRLGVSYFLTPNVALDFSIGIKAYRYKPITELKQDARLGIQFHF